ncbi:histidine kinase [Cellulomonas cellasea]|uniref:histidine kinase n=1 Tax=Cellulomonas cellasea TaxID=43670 RepID=UPI0025A499B8|nr:histidine kinase [Cellulomonas cellasea]MDM8084449.1 histidine kinase [Cellulomonas cellasea]
MSDQQPAQGEPQTPPPSPPEPPTRPEPEVEGPKPVPSEAELRRIATPATVRRAPKVSAFMAVGALVGIVVAIVLVQLSAGDGTRGSEGAGFISFLDGLGAVRFLIGLGLGVLGAFVGGGIAVLLDRRSGRKR